MERTIRHISSYKLGGAILSDIHTQQLFFIDETGALCSKHSGHAIDISGKNISRCSCVYPLCLLPLLDGMLVLRHRRPITHPYPNRYSHELPRFSYDPVSGNISIAFTSDPSFPDPRFQVREPPPTPPEADDDQEESRSHLAASFQITNGSSSSIELSAPEREPTTARATLNSSPFHGQQAATQTQTQTQDDHRPPTTTTITITRPPITLQPQPPTAPPWRRRRATESWKNRVYLLTSLPSRKPKTLLDDAAAFFSSTASILTTPINSFPFSFSSGGAASSSDGGHDNTWSPGGGGGGGNSGSGGGGKGGSGVVRSHIESGEYDLRENEIVEEERAEAEEVDDNPDPARQVKVYGFRPRDLAEGAGNPRARERRRWEIVPIRKERRRF